MRSRSTWKALERSVAEALGGKRVPVSGRGRGDAPDVSHDLFSIEVKAGRVMSTRLREGMRQARAAAGNSGKTPIVAVVQSLRKGEAFSNGKLGRPISERYVLIALDDFTKLLANKGKA